MNAPKHTRPLTANYWEMFHFIKAICLSNLMENSQAAKASHRQDFKESNPFLCHCGTASPPPIGGGDAGL